MEKPQGSLISYMANKVKSEGGINLAQGIPAYAPPKELLSILKNISTEPIHQYAPGIGNHQLLDNLSEIYKLPKQNFLITNGATEAISLLFIYLTEYLKTNFSVLAFDPAYETYRHLPRIFDVPFISFKYDINGEIDFNELEKTIHNHSVKIIMLSSPGNPYGKIWTESELLKLKDITEKHGVYLIIDAVYSELYFKSKPFYPINELSENIFYVNAFSKKLSITGWRIGYLLAHDIHMSKIMDIHDYTGLCAPSILQEAVAQYLKENNNGDEYIQVLRDKLTNNYIQLSKAFSNLGFEVSPADGGYFVWAKLPEKYKCGLDFALDLYKKQKVAVVPGIHFSENAKTYIRINIARESDEIFAAINKIQEFLLKDN
ncbi:MAG: pyridoxal phosphate-dependent aminotransferase [Salinivirgaceae bacterium]|nr:pyridoxal phosphate-dependent aminotransferase [Salinivirgaceae bacterium]